jgi:hypothetical protein
MADFVLIVMIKGPNGLIIRSARLWCRADSQFGAVSYNKSVILLTLDFLVRLGYEPIAVLAVDSAVTLAFEEITVSTADTVFRLEDEL